MTFFTRCLTLLTLLGSIAVQAQTLVSVDRSKINMRAAGSTRAAVEWTLARGYPLQVLGRKSGWLRVRDFEGDTGWVLGRLTAKKAHFVVKVGVANVRSTPSTRSRIVARAEYGEVLRTLERRKGWARVKLKNGRTGWVARRLLWGW